MASIPLVASPLGVTTSHASSPAPSSPRIVFEPSDVERVAKMATLMHRWAEGKFVGFEAPGQVFLWTDEFQRSWKQISVQVCKPYVMKNCEK